MSIASQNPFALLGDDEVPKLAHAVDKKITSSKKADVAPPKADAARANKNRKGPTGNEAVFKDKNAGRDANKSVPAPERTARRVGGARTSRPDRHSQTGKSDTAKKVKKGWGDDNKALDDEKAGENIAAKDEATAGDETPVVAAAKPVEEEDNTQTLEEYLASVSLKNAALDGERTARKANEGQDDTKWKSASEVHKVEEEFLTASHSKNLRSKTKKEKTVLEADLSFAAPQREQREQRGDRNQRRSSPRGRTTRGPRGDARGGRGGARGGAANTNAGNRGRAGAKAPAVNVNSKDEFPTLGA